MNTKTKQDILMVMLALVLLVCVFVFMSKPVSTNAANTSGAESSEYSITINNSVEDYTYVAYQIFTGDYDSATGILSNIEWGDGVNSSSLLSAIVNANADTTSPLYGLFTNINASSSAEDVASILSSSLFTNNSSTSIAFAELVQTCVTGSGTTIPYDSNSKTYTISNLVSGYYLVVNTAVPASTESTEVTTEIVTTEETTEFTTEVNGSEFTTEIVTTEETTEMTTEVTTYNYSTAYSRYMLRVVGGASVNPKSGVPTSTKTVGDRNDSTDSDTETYTYNTTADYDIGDNVHFTLTAEVPEYYGGYNSYKMIFHDTLSDGLTFNSDSVEVTVTTGSTTTKVPVSYTDISASETYTNYSIDATPSDGCSFEVTLSNIKALYDESGSVIEVKSGSTITVTYTAKLNENAAFEETNTMYLEYSNSQYNSDATGITPEEITTVFTYTLQLTKTSNTTSVALEGATFALYKYDAATADYVIVSTQTGTDNGSGVKNIFTFSGLDDGYYKLVETVTPAGYNTMDDLYFTVEATHSEDSNGVAYVSSLRVTQTDSSHVGLSTVTQTFSVDATTGIIAATIINSSGSSLPITGGVGTTMLYIGGVFLCGTAVLFAVKKRMRVRAR